MKYIISYDLNKKDKDYEGLFEAIKTSSNGIWCKPCKSTWLIQSNYSVSELYKSIQSAIDGNDDLIIVEITGNIYGQMEKEVVNKIKENFNK